jgi:hypothetical protein
MLQTHLENIIVIEINRLSTEWTQIDTQFKVTMPSAKITKI